jgi:hypothetical protein
MRPGDHRESGRPLTGIMRRSPVTSASQAT